MDYDDILPPPQHLIPVTVPNSIKSIQDLDLEAELLRQYNAAQTLLATCQYDSSTPANQKAQVINSITAILVQLTKAQTDLYNSSRLKILENTLIFTLKKYPELQAEFLDTYTEALKNV